jgi:hypothetical protein
MDFQDNDIITFSSKRLGSVYSEDDDKCLELVARIKIVKAKPYSDKTCALVSVDFADNRVNHYHFVKYYNLSAMIEKCRGTKE